MMRYIDETNGLMREINWDTFLNKIIDNLRIFYDSQLSQKDLPKKDQDEIFADSFLAPCQVEVLDSDGEAVLLVVHDNERRDREFIIKKRIKSYGESEFAHKYKLNLPRNFDKTEPAVFSKIWIVTANNSFSFLLEKQRL